MELSRSISETLSSD